jgi:hypothetical protein
VGALQTPAYQTYDIELFYSEHMYRATRVCGAPESMGFAVSHRHASCSARLLYVSRLVKYKYEYFNISHPLCTLWTGPDIFRCSCRQSTVDLQRTAGAKYATSPLSF